MIQSSIDKVKKTKNSIITMILSSFSMLFFAPISVFMENAGEIWVDFWDVLPLVVFVFLMGTVLILVTWGLFMRINKTVARIYCFLVAVISLEMYVQGNFLLGDIKSLDGTELDWSALLPNFKSVLLLTIFLVVGIVTYRVWGRDKWFGIVKNITLCLCLLEVFTITVSGTMNGGFKSKDTNFFTRKNEFTYSSKSNVTILILDQFDGKYMSQLLEENPEYEEKLDGFSFYPDTLSRYNRTMFSIPQMISGVESKLDKSYEDYLRDVLNDSYFLNNLKEQNYRLNMYAYIDWPSVESTELFENYMEVNVGVSSKRKLLQYIYQLAGYRYLPFYLKQYCWFYSDDISDLRYIKQVDGKTDFDELEGEVYNWNNFEFYTSLEQINTVEENMFHLIHLRGVHSPISRNSEFEIDENATELDAAKACMKMLDRFINELKENNAYDNNVIIVMGDHGSSPYGNNMGKQNPLLLVKGLNESHKLEVSDKKVSYTELNDIYERLMKGFSGVEAVQGTDQTRYIWIANENDVVQFDEYSVDGNAYNADDIIKTGKEIKKN